MTATQILAKLGADSTYNKSDLTAQELNAVMQLNQSSPDFAPPLTHECPDDDEEEESEEEKG